MNKPTPTPTESQNGDTLANQDDDEPTMDDLKRMAGALMNLPKGALRGIKNPKS